MIRAFKKGNRVQLALNVRIVLHSVDKVRPYLSAYNEFNRILEPGEEQIKKGTRCSILGRAYDGIYQLDVSRLNLIFGKIHINEVYVSKSYITELHPLIQLAEAAVTSQ